jgi:hypothetical protein
MERHLAVADGLVAAGVGGQDAAQGAPSAAVHERVAREGAVQVLLYLHVPVVGGRVPRLRAAVRPPAPSQRRRHEVPALMPVADAS